jgi:hypothetical protein
MLGYSTTKIWKAYVQLPNGQLQWMTVQADNVAAAQSLFEAYGRVQSGIQDITND